MENFDWTDKHILIAEDHEICYLLFEEALAPTNVNLIRAQNGNDALQKIKDHACIDLVLMDMEMPIMSGYEATSEIKIMRSNLPIIAQTVHTSFQDKSLLFESGCDDLIPKPINLNMLMNKIDFWLKNHS